MFGAVRDSVMGDLFVVVVFSVRFWLLYGVLQQFMCPPERE
jgi:hypothetical protein